MDDATKRTAHRAVRAALARGDLVRPKSCSRCGDEPLAGSDGRASIQAHHHDYSKPLEIEWICPTCHRKETPLPTVIGGKAIGVINGASKLTDVDVLAARRLRASGLSFVNIARQFGISKVTARYAVLGKTWSHVKESP